MYDRILVTLDATPTDRAIIDHIKALAPLHHSRIILLHVATGVSAQYNGADAAGEEVDRANAYLRQISAEFAEAEIPVEAVLAFGDPAREIVKWVESKGCDLVAMSTHGHRALGDLVFGATASKVQHSLNIPVLMLRAK